MQRREGREIPRDPDQPVILIVEDEVALQNLARITLERAGYFVLTANDGEAALSLSRGYPGQIHLLLTDVAMPKMSGLELSERLSSERRNMRIIIMGGDTSVVDVDLPILEKPFTPKELTDIVKWFVPLGEPDPQRDLQALNSKVKKAKHAQTDLD